MPLYPLTLRVAISDDLREVRIGDFGIAHFSESALYSAAETKPRIDWRISSMQRLNSVFVRHRKIIASISLRSD